MKKLLLSLALITSTLPSFADGFNMPSFGNNNASNWNMPNMNWGNNSGNNTGSNWNMPNMNWGNNSGNNTGSNWNMPNMNWGNNNGNSSSWNIPTMNWGNNNGSNDSNWSMPAMNWGNNTNGLNNDSNWNMPNMNWNNNSQPWALNNNTPQYYMQPYYNTIPKAQMMPQLHKPARATPPQFIPQINTKKPIAQSTQIVKKANTTMRIPIPSEVNGIILAPENKKFEVESTK